MFDPSKLETAAAHWGSMFESFIKAVAHTVAAYTPVAVAVETAVAPEAVPVTELVGTVATGVGTAMESIQDSISKPPVAVSVALPSDSAVSKMSGP